ncbi:MAG TPA: mycofactocin biosynthesis peptidyl-dipeptidase MftE [Mycobacteriales bacterium]|nr:mycofactocin biosynthesis peptidyl-dipeptidase MftE [Mycobacteriales bacterium]
MIADRSSVSLADLAWPVVGERCARGAVLAVPVGSTEQHGPQLPLSTDTDIAGALCERLAAVRDDVIIAPAIAYGSSGEHEGFPGTLSIGQQCLEYLVVELVRSASRTFPAVLLVCAHGGNAAPLMRAVACLRAESRDVLLFLPRCEGDAHAGRTETSIMLALHPDRTRMNLAVPGNMRPLAELMPTLRSAGVRAVSESGVLGDPVGATADEGSALLDQLEIALVDQVVRWREERS